MLSLIPFWLKAAILAGAVALGGVTGWWLTRDHYTGVIAKEQAALAQDVIHSYQKGASAQAAADKTTHDADVANAAAHQQIQIVYRNIVQKVPQYVTVKTDRAFALPCGFIRLHDAAASNSADPSAVPLPSGKSDADGCDVTISDAARIIAGNYATALGWQADLKTWDGWYTKQRSNYDAYLASLKKEN
jgi:hypothetical protein